MNLDYLIPNTPAICRRLSYASQVMGMVLDPKIVEGATKGLLDPQQVMASLPDKLSEHVPNIPDFCQYATDFNHKVIILNQNELQLRRTMLAHGLASGEQLLILGDEVDRTAWSKVLKDSEVKFKRFNDTQEDYSTDQIVMAEVVDLTNNFINTNRHRIVLWVRGTRSNIFNAFTKKEPQTIVSLDFPQIITGCVLPANTTKWWDNYQILAILEESYDTINWTKVFGHKNTGLADMKFHTTDPDAIGRMFGVYLDVSI